jgi:hypothetical protein
MIQNNLVRIWHGFLTTIFDGSVVFSRGFQPLSHGLADCDKAPDL